jgi:hypothetical protein
MSGLGDPRMSGLGDPRMSGLDDPTDPILEPNGPQWPDRERKMQ